MKHNKHKCGCAFGTHMREVDGACGVVPHHFEILNCIKAKKRKREKQCLKCGSDIYSYTESGLCDFCSAIKNLWREDTFENEVLIALLKVGNLLIADNKKFRKEIKE